MKAIQQLYFGCLCASSWCGGEDYFIILFIIIAMTGGEVSVVKPFEKRVPAPGGLVRGSTVLAKMEEC